ncbi:pth2 Peptidyl-tRNA hydrolase [uncultured Caudovirales phage]|uniref:peptidyl-tRNA hydrolase n=1 Tax=uncultured Caudovirales phage TaxID=2100421 RepID=A0A6J5KNJ2_9CAUD|nr:pth2 Peptidyl-tRNA hydrolase [uncultured Caudovirales phage]
MATQYTKEQVVYIVMRSDLGMRKGKAAAQAAHAVGEIILPTGCAVVVVRVHDRAALYAIIREAMAEEVWFHLVVDSGRTQVAPLTSTCVAVGPFDRDAVPQWLRSLPLF